VVRVEGNHVHPGHEVKSDLRREVMSDEKQGVQIRRDGNRLYVQRIGKDGNRIGVRTEWTIGRKSALPRELFFTIRGFVHSSLTECQTKSLEKLRVAARNGLVEAAGVCGCEPKLGKSKADVYWRLDGFSLIAWQLHGDEVDADRARKLVTSKASLRIVIVLKESGWFNIIPQDTREAA
jgi:hypothetical protein